MTFSIVAYDSENVEWGVAVQSKLIAVGSIVPFGNAGVGVIASQSWCNTSYGPKGLALLKQGLTAEETISIITKQDEKREHRQLGIVDSHGNAASFTGRECFDWAGHIVGENYACQGNILVSDETVFSMSQAYRETKGDLVEKLLTSLEAGQEAGGDSRGKQAAAVLVFKEKGSYDGGTDRYIDLRVDDHEHPIKELRRVFELYNLSFLKRDDPKDKVKLEGDVIKSIKEVLKLDGFYDGEIDSKYDAVTKESLQKWMHTNNFEAKEREDKFMWGSVYRYIEKRKEEIG
ncbi:MAG: DUF1028 domain-containing protein [Candidatus Heimdallarchaeota archaeon]|nr:DUF1028 domain-containing protein [Candidatus Heimdallarchaeota archaeon]MCK4954976.1 DUF1028 domain-containing protein [Candidatus Heimdallarchaeota archaeon]